MHPCNKQIKDQLRVVPFMQTHKQFVDFVYIRERQILLLYFLAISADLLLKEYWPSSVYGFVAKRNAVTKGNE